MKRIGFTGTGRAPLTQPQRERLALELARRVSPEGLEVHLGDCVHADAECHELATRLRETGLPVRTVGHPPLDGSKRANCVYDEEREPREYLPRDEDIVREGEDELLACPRYWGEERRSGTWTTVRRGLEAGRTVLLIWPDGTTADGREWYQTFGRMRGTLRAVAQQRVF